MKPKKFFLECVKCGNKKSFTTFHAFQKSKKNNVPCNKCKRTFKQKWKEELSDDEFEEKMTQYRKTKSDENKGVNNHMYGRTMVDVWNEKYDEETVKLLKLNHSENTSKKNGRGMTNKSVHEVWISRYGQDKADNRWKERNKLCSLPGDKNGMYGKPSPQGSGNGWSGWYKGWYFRSLRELSYMVSQIEVNNWKWRSAETKDLKIKWVDYSGNERNYNADFLCEEKTLIEIKPKRLHNTPTVLAKKKYAIDFCEQHGYNYLLTDCDLIPFELILELHNKKTLIFLEKYKNKFETLISERRNSSE